MAGKQPVLLVIYGAGGHKTEMKRLLVYLKATQTSDNMPYGIVSLGAGPLVDKQLAHYEARDVRDKVSRWHSLRGFVPVLFASVRDIMAIARHYKVQGVLSTGPGLCILPMLFFRLLGVKTIFVETFCRFSSRSMTGRIMYRLAHRFLIQNRELQTLYPKAEYSGRL